MALFAQDDAFIRSRLRLSSVPTSSEDTLAIVADSIARARLSIYRRIGRQRVAHVLLTAEVASPDTDDEVVRSVATGLELKLVERDLLRRLPSAFMDASGDLNRRWNEEAPFRERPRSDQQRELQRLSDEIEEDFQIVAGEESTGDERGILSYDGTPTTEPPLPGDSLLGTQTRPAAEDP